MNDFEIAVVNEPSVFEPLKVYCMYTCTSRIITWHIALKHIELMLIKRSCCFTVDSLLFQPGCIAQSVEHLSRVRGPEFNTRSCHILSFLLPLIQEGQLSVTGESMCTKYWLRRSKPAQEKCG